MINNHIHLLVFVFVLAVTHAFSQEEEIQYHKYRNEMAIDVQGVLGDVIGNVSLVYKRRKPETGLIAVNEKTAYRFRFSVNGDVPLGKFNIDTLVGSFINLYSTSLESFSIGGGIGLERQLNRERIQYFYGIDAGYQYTRTRYTRYFQVTSLPSGKREDYRDTQTNRVNSALLIPFFGFKYFILPELSLSIESGLSSSLNFNNLQESEYAFSSQATEITQQARFRELSFYFDFVRSLNLSYYF